MKSFLLVCFFLTTSLRAQQFSQREAEGLVRKVTICLRARDTAGFVSLWDLDPHRKAFHLTPITEQQLRSAFSVLLRSLDTAFIRGLSPVTRLRKANFILRLVGSGKYQVSALFRYADYYHKGFLLFLKHEKGKWVLSSAPFEYVDTTRP